MTAPPPPPPACPLCGNAAGNATLDAREMMFGTREPFTYGACGACESLWLLDVPEDLGPYYPPDYYSYARMQAPSPLRAYLRRAWARHHLVRPTLLGRLLTRASGTAQFFDWVRRSGATFDSRILDVGCGQGTLLRRMHWSGFRHLTGADPFIAGETTTPEGIPLLKRPPEEVDGTFDLVMCHHALEHMRDPRGALRAMRRLLAPGGTLLVRVPLADSWARRHYGAHWYALDAPRHLFLFTRASMKRLEADAGLAEREVVYDAYAFSLWTSEQYVRGIPLMDDERSHFRNPDCSPFTDADVAAFEARAQALNARGEGDTAAFYLHAR